MQYRLDISEENPFAHKTIFEIEISGDKDSSKVESVSIYSIDEREDYSVLTMDIDELHQLLYFFDNEDLETEVTKFINESQDNFMFNYEDEPEDQEDF